MLGSECKRYYLRCSAVSERIQVQVRTMMSRAAFNERRTLNGNRLSKKINDRPKQQRHEGLLIEREQKVICERYGLLAVLILQSHSPCLVIVAIGNGSFLVPNNVCTPLVNSSFTSGAAGLK